MSLTALDLVGRTTPFHAFERVVLAWEAIAGVSVGVLCVSYADLAVMGRIVVPAVFTLAMPRRFRWTAIIGSTTAAGLTIVSFLARPQLTPFALPATTEGMSSVGLMTLATNLLIVVRSNRGRRLEWTAIQDSRRAYPTSPRVGTCSRRCSGPCPFRSSCHGMATGGSWA